MQHFSRWALLGLGLALIVSHAVLADGRERTTKATTDGSERAVSRDAKVRDARGSTNGISASEGRIRPIVVTTPIVSMPVSASSAKDDDDDGGDGGVAGVCPPVISQWTDSNFGPGSYILQGGFAEQEVAAVSFTLDPSNFPLRIDMTEMIFGTSNATVQTTTKWSILIWEGTPATGQLVYAFSSDGEILPHIVLPPGTSGVNVQFMVDPNDPEQLFISNNGSNTFSVGYRIDQHNSQTQNPCFVAPPSNLNAFPATDVGGLASLTGNWLFAINCGPFGCPAGWSTFGQLPTLCRPSGDWVIRVTWTPINCAIQGACCFGPGNCQFLTQAQCAAQGGSYQGDNVPCGLGGGACASTSVACCFASTGGCLNLAPTTCIAAGGVPGPFGSVCAGFVCFPTGACCLPNGTCIGPVSPETCLAQGGTFQGNGTNCAQTSCPPPIGGCCFPTGFCLPLTEADCLSVGATWGGIGSTCVDGNGNGTADLCEAPPTNPADLDGDGIVGPADLAILLGRWGQSGQGDIDGDGIVGSSDLAILLGAWSS
jgi:hypothetical protein